MDAIRQWDNVLDSLAAEPRRQIITSLLEAEDDQWVSLPEAAESPHISDSETLHILLKHYHLPKLAEHGYIQWEENPFRVKRGPNFHVISAITKHGLEGAGEYPAELVKDYELMGVYL